MTLTPRQTLEHESRSRGLRFRQARLWMSAREGRKISQGEVAQLMTEELRRRGILKKPSVVHQTRVSRIESGREVPTIYETEAMEAVTGTPAAFLAFNVPLDVLHAVTGTLVRQPHPTRPRPLGGHASRRKAV
jgi:transcriptional regulator with XRE-family HTH domain